MKTLIIYHGGCVDGFTAAWIFSKRYPDAEFLPAFYGQSPPDVTGRDVIMVDFSYKRLVLQTMMDTCSTLVILDHHESAERELANLTNDNRIQIIFDMKRSGAMLAWDWCHPKLDAPMLVKYVQDRDLWTKVLVMTDAVSAAIRSYQQTFENWDSLNLSHPMDLAREGIAILRREAQIIDRAVKRAFEIDILGHKVLCTNVSECSSEIGEKLAVGRPFGVTYFDRIDLIRQFSLRSNNEGENVSLIAAKLGGGGHRNAAGFEITLNNTAMLQKLADICEHEWSKSVIGVIVETNERTESWFCRKCKKENFYVEGKLRNDLLKKEKQ